MLLGLTIAGLIPCAIYVFALSYAAWVVLGLTCFVSVVYSAPIIKWEGKITRLRDIAGTKIFLVALTWMMVCVWIPYADANESALSNIFSENHKGVWVWSGVCFLLIFALTIPFDIRDMEYDQGTLRSLPMIIGERNSVWLSQLMLAGSAFLFTVVHELHWAFYCTFYLAWVVIAIIVVGFCKRQRHEYYFLFLVDGLILLIPCFLKLGGDSF